MWPIIGMVVGGLLFIGCAAWLYANNSSANAEILDALKRYVLPRHLTEEQIAMIGDYLKQYEPQRFKMTVFKNSEEASVYRADIQQALTRGGWKLSTIDYSQDLPEGLSIQFTETPESAQSERDPNHPKADDLLSEAFDRAGVPISQRGGGSGAGVTANSLTIRIGHRRMDDSDLVAKRQMEEEARKLLKGAKN